MASSPKMMIRRGFSVPGSHAYSTRMVRLADTSKTCIQHHETLVECPGVLTRNCRLRQTVTSVAVSYYSNVKMRFSRSSYWSWSSRFSWPRHTRPA